MNERSVTAKSRNTYINVKHLEEKGISYKKYYWIDSRPTGIKYRCNY